jgi:quercetin dioxygenase-like cupin family protein
VHYAKNEGSTPAEAYVTFVAVPVGAELRKTEPNPGGANCPSETAGPELTRTDLARSKVAGPVSVQATAASDVAMQTIKVEPGGSGGWHSHPAATFVAVKSGTLTLYRGNAAGCASQSYSAGQGFLEPAGDVHVNRNEGSTPVELYVTFLAAPVGGALRTDLQSPGGANCPDPNPVEQTAPQGATQLPRTGSALAGLLAALGVGLAGAGTAARSLARRR